MRQPVIAFTHAPWQSGYSFVRSWQNPEDYERLLDSLSIETWSPPSESELNSLFAYILEYRMNDYQMMHPGKNRRWFQFLKMYTGNECIELTSENYLKFEELFQTITAEDPIFQQFIKHLADSN